MESSINIVSVSEHRKAAIDATEWAIDTLKQRVPIWKKEYYIKEGDEKESDNL